MIDLTLLTSPYLSLITLCLLLVITVWKPHYLKLPGLTGFNIRLAYIVSLIGTFTLSFPYSIFVCIFVPFLTTTVLKFCRSRSTSNVE
jgi:hypothetical protein